MTRRSVLGVSVVAFLVLGVTPAASAQVTAANVDTSRWMEDLPGIADLPLTALPIPGTHDSGTYSLNASSPWSLAAKTDPSLQVLMSLPSYLTLPIGLEWSRAQRQTVAQQLLDGIRYVDLRLSDEPDGQIYLVHGLRGALATEALNDIALFASSFPKEIVLVEAHSFTNFSSQSHALFLSQVRGAFGSRMVPAALGTSVTPRQLWALDRNVIFIYNDPSVPFAPGNGDLWPESTLDMPWANVTTASALFAATQGYLAQRNPQAIFGIQGTVTPDAQTIIDGLLGAGPTSLEAMVTSIHPDIMSWIVGPFRQGLNLITCDFYDGPWPNGGNFVRDVLASVAVPVSSAPAAATAPVASTAPAVMAPIASTVVPASTAVLGGGGGGGHGGCATGTTGGSPAALVPVFLVAFLVLRGRARAEPGGRRILAQVDATKNASARPARNPSERRAKYRS